jgi:hypothetical protein
LAETLELKAPFQTIGVPNSPSPTGCSVPSIWQGLFLCSEVALSVLTVSRMPLVKQHFASSALVPGHEGMARAFSIHIGHFLEAAAKK